MRVALTGACGFIGGALCRDLRARGHEVVPLARNAGWENVGDAGSVSFLADPGWLAGCEVVIHSAGLAHRTGGTLPSREEFLRANRDATLEVARAAVNAGVRRFLFLSSVGVLGGATGDRILDESSPAAPHDDYTASKLAAEEVLKSSLEGRPMDWVIVRLPMVIGPGAPGNWERLVRWIQAGRWMPVPSKEGVRSYLTLPSLLAYVSACLGAAAVSRKIVLIADSPAIRFSELAQGIARGLRLPLRLVKVPNVLLRIALTLAGRSADARRLTESLRIDSARSWQLAGATPVSDIHSTVRESAHGELAKRNASPKGCCHPR